MRVQWYRIKRTYEKPHGGFLAIGPRYPGVLLHDGRCYVLETDSWPFPAAISKFGLVCSGS